MLELELELASFFTIKFILLQDVMGIFFIGFWVWVWVLVRPKLKPQTQNPMKKMEKSIGES
jgi:hypothetical protein